jgi:hypothetical protein
VAAVQLTALGHGPCVAGTDDEAVQAIAELLGTDAAAAAAVLDLQLRRFTPANRARIDAERRKLRGDD